MLKGEGQFKNLMLRGHCLCLLKPNVLCMSMCQIYVHYRFACFQQEESFIKIFEDLCCNSGLQYFVSDLIAYPVCLFVETDPIAHSGIKIVIIAFLMFKLEMHQHNVEIKEDIWRFQSGFIQPFITFVYYYRSFHENGINWHLS